jgi:hypothetical protein
MNQFISERDYEKVSAAKVTEGKEKNTPRPDLQAKAEDRAGSAPLPGAERSQLTQAEATELQRMLTGGEMPLARQHDVVELHNRIVKMFTTLNEGLGGTMARKAQQDRNALSLRMDELESAVNRMEGALRIELEPMLRKVVEESVHQKVGSARFGRGRALMVVALVLTALTCGVAFHDSITRFAGGTVAAMETKWGNFMSD